MVLLRNGKVSIGMRTGIGITVVGMILIMVGCASRPAVMISPAFRPVRAKIAILPFSGTGREEIKN